MIDQAAAEKAVWWIKEHAEEMAEARSNRLYMEQSIKTVRADIQAEHAELSVAASEVAALSSNLYKQALLAYKNAIRTDEYLRWMATAAEAQVEAWRTISANERAEGKAT